MGKIVMEESMSSPFPGMDPYLERKENWRGFHNKFIAYLSDLINEYLPAPLVAAVEERVYVATERPDSIVADFAIVRNPASVVVPPQNSVTAVLERNQTENYPGARESRIFETEVRERFIQIINPRHGDRRGRQVVTVIEVLSPTNKRGEGRDIYRRKQWETLQSDSHLVEIDLLRGGVPTVMVPVEVLVEVGRFDYIVCLHRINRRGYAVYWPFRLREALPEVVIPLTEEFADLIIPLQTAFNTTYDRGAFERLLDYAAPLDPPLATDDAEWADTLLTLPTAG